MNDLVRAVRRRVPPSVLTAALFLLCSVAIYAVCLAIDLNTALKGVYVLLACTMVLLLLHTEDMQLSRLSEFEIQPTQATRLVLTLTVLSLIIGTATDVLLVPVTVTLALGNGLIVVQIFGRERQRIHLFGQILLINSLLPALKYLRTGFYGANDTLKHVRYVEMLLQDGTPASIPEVYAEKAEIYIKLCDFSSAI